MNSTSSREIGFGICGLGMVADFHAQALALVPGAKLVAVASRQREKTRAFAEKHHVGIAVATMEELVTQPGVDAVCITTSSGAHLEPALVAIRAGKHVMIEKPVEITTERADQILHAAAAAGVQVGAIFQGRFGDGARTVKAAVAAGRLGRMVLASASVKWHRTAPYYSGTRGSFAADGGGALMAQGIHAVDLLQWFAGMPAEVFGWSTRRVHTGIEAEDTLVASLKFQDGAVGSIEASTALWPGWRRRLELCGEKGSIALEDDHIARWEFREPVPGDADIQAAQDGAVLGSGASVPSAISVVGHQRQLQDFVAALRAGRAPSLDGREGRKAVALVRAIYDSAASGAPMRIV
ncbi:MAG: Gfo/Idh/MocA family oxidoreductase [Opitutaceae bacterium]